jgi:pullulanase
MLAQGIPFIEGGVEMGRTKGGNGNSYNSGDSVNAYMWDVTTPVEYAYTKGLIELRKGHPVFRLRTADEIRTAFSTTGLPQSDEMYSYRLTAKSGPFREYIVCFVGGTKAQRLVLPKGKWNVLSDGTLAGAKPVGTAEGTQLVQPLSAFVFAR